MIPLSIDVVEIDCQLVRRILQTDFLAPGKDLMAPMLFVPLGERGRHMHLLDNVAPSHTGVVGTE